MIRIEKVQDKQELKEFITFPSTLFRDDPNWIDPLFIEREEHLSKKNPGTDHITWQAWVAKREGKVVGRITAQIDTLHRELHGDDTGHFGMIDAVDDPEVFSALFAAAEEWLRSQGARKITGPFSLNINQESGLLIDGFDTPPSTMMPHSKPYYAARVEEQGYSKGIDLLAYWMQRTDLHFNPSLSKLMDRVRSQVTIRRLNRKQFAQEMQVMREIFNSGWQHNWGFVPFTEHEFATMGDQLKFLVPDDMIYIAEIEGKPCAFIVGMPNINEAVADLHGRLLPLGWAKLLWRLKVSGVRTARVPLMGVREEYQFSRIGPVIALLLIEALRDPFKKRNIDALEMSWILESNTGMNNILKKIGALPYKQYRLYEKQI
ncbi:TPA: GNAT family N-acetyltransferase [Pluralibacter gergoviae]|uniref:DNA-binding protein n=1 Tax=Pluralibacter gergoviae TaxID=61647 RepID=A0A0J5L1E7_PLUGE|nr:GNAT family N-acetyltransferase [Pluralibacter gergoviae]EKT9640369.1 GNAT family N-acetyltransferase [Pluralibacter gergoviae]EKV3542912.1 GNAT family N-acetyltransferase [Pluralibacter gergoviae]EKV9897972.1 GNAT family N-acetyltransferase [Pluralibacter gergoviae]EKV9929175.1 GNAT family N-acetyltransferase [Pluralibacter gergoviae]EKW9975385.1 GNAT family N-acetyltransferase [Pluralibacter gergoviae]